MKPMQPELPSLSSLQRFPAIFRTGMASMRYGSHSRMPSRPSGRSRGQAFVLGAGTAQVAYNAAVLRDPQSDAGFRDALASIPAYAGISPRVRADILALQSIPYATNGGDWSTINTAGSRATTDIATLP